MNQFLERKRQEAQMRKNQRGIPLVSNVVPISERFGIQRTGFGSDGTLQPGNVAGVNQNPPAIFHEGETRFRMPEGDAYLNAAASQAISPGFAGSRSFASGGFTPIVPGFTRPEMPVYQVKPTTPGELTPTQLANKQRYEAAKAAGLAGNAAPKPKATTTLTVVGAENYGAGRQSIIDQNKQNPTVNPPPPSAPPPQPVARNVGQVKTFLIGSLGTAGPTGVTARFERWRAEPDKAKVLNELKALGLSDTEAGNLIKTDLTAAPVQPTRGVVVNQVRPAEAAPTPAPVPVVVRGASGPEVVKPIVPPQRTRDVVVNPVRPTEPEAAVVPPPQQIGDSSTLVEGGGEKGGRGLAGMDLSGGKMYDTKEQAAVVPPPEVDTNTFANPDNLSGEVVWNGTKYVPIEEYKKAQKENLKQDSGWVWDGTNFVAKDTVEKPTQPAGADKTGGAGTTDVEDRARRMGLTTLTDIVRGGSDAALLEGRRALQATLARQGEERKALAQRQAQAGMEPNAARAEMASLVASQESEINTMAGQYATGAMQARESAAGQLAGQGLAGKQFGLSVKAFDVGTDQWERTFANASDQWKQTFAEDKKRWGQTEAWKSFEYAAQYGTPEDAAARYKEATGKNMDPDVLNDLRTTRKQGVEAGSINLESLRQNLGDQKFNSIQARINAGASQAMIERELGADTFGKTPQERAANFKGMFDASPLGQWMATFAEDKKRWGQTEAWKAFENAAQYGTPEDAAARYQEATGKPMDPDVLNDLRTSRKQGVQVGEINLKSLQNALGDQRFNSIQSRINAGASQAMVEDLFGADALGKTPEERAANYRAMFDATPLGERSWNRRLQSANMLLQTPGAENKRQAAAIYGELFPGTAINFDQLITDENQERVRKGMAQLSDYIAAGVDLTDADGNLTQAGKDLLAKDGTAANLGMNDTQISLLWKSMERNAIDDAWKGIESSDVYKGMSDQERADVKEFFKTSSLNMTDWKFEDEYQVTGEDGITKTFIGLTDAQEYAKENGGEPRPTGKRQMIPRDVGEWQPTDEEEDQSKPGEGKVEVKPGGTYYQNGSIVRNSGSKSIYVSQESQSPTPTSGAGAGAGAGGGEGDGTKLSLINRIDSSDFNPTTGTDLADLQAFFKPENRSLVPDEDYKRVVQKTAEYYINNPKSAKPAQMKDWQAVQVEIIKQREAAGSPINDLWGALMDSQWVNITSKDFLLMNKKFTEGRGAGKNYAYYTFLPRDNGFVKIGNQLYKVKVSHPNVAFDFDASSYTVTNLTNGKAYHFYAGPASETGNDTANAWKQLRRDAGLYDENNNPRPRGTPPPGLGTTLAPPT